ncbi:MAG: methylamine utilization protein MauE [Sphingomonas fennica]
MLATIALSFATAAGICCALLFGFGGIAKLRHRAELPAVIANYRLLPPAAIRPAAALLPPAELLLATALLAGGRAAAWAALPAAALLTIFAAAMAINIRRGRARIDCGCGIGGLHQPLRMALVRRNLLLAAALLPLLPASFAGPLDGLTHLAAAAAGGAAFLLLLLLDALLALPPAPAAA